MVLSLCIAGNPTVFFHTPALRGAINSVVNPRPTLDNNHFSVALFSSPVGHTDYLRGCMADIVYNGANVIKYAKSRKGQSEATAVTWGCSPEFDATRSTEVSFVEDGAFTAIPRPIPRSGSRYVTKIAFSSCKLYLSVYLTRKEPAPARKTPLSLSQAAELIDIQASLAVTET